MTPVSHTGSELHIQSRLFINFTTGRLFKRFSSVKSTTGHYPENRSRGWFNTPAEKDAVPRVDENSSRTRLIRIMHCVKVRHLRCLIRQTINPPISKNGPITRAVMNSAHLDVLS
jgi:hypothetical protein